MAHKFEQCEWVRDFHKGILCDLYKLDSGEWKGVTPTGIEAKGKTYEEVWQKIKEAIGEQRCGIKGNEEKKKTDPRYLLRQIIGYLDECESHGQTPELQFWLDDGKPDSEARRLEIRDSEILTYKGCGCWYGVSIDFKEVDNE